jgi:hypothetical protein
MSTHPNSKKVTIKRLLPFNHEAQQGLDDWFANANTAIGSYFKAGGSKRVETGLEDWEADELLPGMVNADSDDRDFREKIEKYYVDINTKIPAEGKTLEIGLKETNSKPIMYKDGEAKVKNFPISLEDYLIYRHAIKHPYLAKDKLEGESNPLKKFYLEDKTKESSELVKQESLKDEALAAYLGIAKDEKKVDLYLSVLGLKYKNIKKEERALTLKRKANENPQSFIDALNDTHAPTKFFINKLVSASIIRKEGARYLFEGEQLGASLDDFVHYMEDKANSETVGVLKAKYNEFAKEAELAKD